MNENYDDCHHRKTTRTFIYTKSQKNCETFLYTKSRTLFKKLDNFRCVLYTKSHTLDVTGFSWSFWSWHLYKKSMTLCVTWRFYIKKARHFVKSKTIGDTILYTKSRHFALRNFHWSFEICGGEGHLFIKKTMHFAWHFYILKNAPCITLLYT